MLGITASYRKGLLAPVTFVLAHNFDRDISARTINTWRKRLCAGKNPNGNGALLAMSGRSRVLRLTAMLPEVARNVTIHYIKFDSLLGVAVQKQPIEDLTESSPSVLPRSQLRKLLRESEDKNISLESHLDEALGALEKEVCHCI